jgi:exodeoxyribonuclease VII large subunit
VIRAVAAARTPVVSAIGHEPDTPLLDLVADLRASTPTDAAKLLVPDVAEELQRVNQLRDRARHHVGTWLRHETAQLTGLRARPVLADPRGAILDREREVGELTDRARRTLSHCLARGADDVEHARARVRALSPLETLRRGYAVLQDDTGQVVTSVDAVGPGARVTARVLDGWLAATIDATRPDPAVADLMPAPTDDETSEDDDD